MRLRLLAPALSVLTLAAPAALAQDGAGSIDPVAAVRGFLTDAELLGADTATVGSVTADGDTVTASDVAMRWSGSFTLDEEDTVVVSALVTIDSLEVTGLAATGTGHAADELVVPTANILVEVSGAEIPLTYDFTVTDYRVTGASWNAFPRIEADAARPVSRFSPLVDWSIHQSYESNSVALVAGTVVTGDDRQELSYGPITLGPVVDGTLESFEYGPMTTTQTTEMPSPETGEMVPGTITFRYGASRGEFVDAKPIGALLTGTGAGGGPQTVIGSVVLESTDVEVGDVLSMSIGENRMEDFTIDASGEPLMETLDRLVLAAINDEEPAPDDLVGILFDAYGAFGVGLYSLADIEVAGPDFSAQMDEVMVEELSREGLGLVAVRGTEINAPGGSGGLGAFEIAEMTFPEREAVMNAMMASMAGMEPDTQTVLAAVPTLGRITVSDFEAVSPDMGVIELGLFETEFEDFITAIPTSIALTLEGLRMPLSLIPEPQIAMIMQSLGADPVTGDASIALAWDEETGDLDLDAAMAVGRVGALEADAGLTGIPRSIFENPEEAQEIAATAGLSGLDLSFEDDGLTRFLIGMVAQQSGLTPDQFVEGIGQQVRMQAEMMTQDGGFAAEVAGAVSAFLGDPRSFRIAADPDMPVPFAQLIAAAMTAPQALPGLLNLSIDANR